MRLTASCVVLVAVPSIVVAQVIPRQSPRLELDNELRDPTGLVVGVAGVVMYGGEEAFESVGPGIGGQLFVGSKFGVIDELRAGVSLGTSSEELSDDRVQTLSVYLESYFATDVLGVAVRVGPRLAWMRESRTVFVADHLSGLGAGGNAGVLIPLESHVAIESGASATLFMFGAADIEGLPPDADRQSYGWVCDLRIGVRWRLK